MGKIKDLKSLFVETKFERMISFAYVHARTHAGVCMAAA
jgi:hypothetical protein